MKIKEAKEGINEHAKDLIELCPHCGAKAHIEALWNDYHKYRDGDVEFYVVFRCKPCKKLILKTFYLEQNRYSREEQLTMKGWDEIFPIQLDDQLSNEEKAYIPEQVLLDYQEALKCKSVGAHRASCSMFRRALQGSLLELGANHKQDLIQQINSLGNLPHDIKDWSHQIRILGNWGAHPDKDNLKEVDIEETDEVYDFVSKFFLYVFIMPEKVKLSREKRDEKMRGKQEEQQPEG